MTGAFYCTVTGIIIVFIIIMASNRYCRQMIMPQVGGEGQAALSSSKVLVIGAGGIGSTVVLYLAAAGIPTDVMDFDLVEVSNLHRQIVHSEAEAGKEKAVSAVEHMNRINSTVQCNALVSKITPTNAACIISQYDLVVDATDNIDARYTINDCCVRLRKPFVSGSAVSMDGQITTVIPYQTPCYRCLYPKLTTTMGGCRSCADAGVLGPVPGLIGCLEAIEVMKLLLNRDKYCTSTVVSEEPGEKRVAPDTATTGQGKRQRSNGQAAGQLVPLLGRQMLYDGVSGEFHTFQLPPRRKDCEACGAVSADSAVVGRASQVGAPMNGGDRPAPALPALPDAHRIDAEAFAVACRTPHSAQHVVPLVLDVRSPEQFSIAHLSEPGIKVYNSLPGSLEDIRECSAAERVKLLQEVKAVVVNVPLLALRGGKVGTDREERQRDVLNELLELCALLRPETQTVSESGISTDTVRQQDSGGDVYVLCRRGIDSATASQLLLAAGWDCPATTTAAAQKGAAEVRVRNVEGGLTAWTARVDPAFPMY